MGSFLDLLHAKSLSGLFISVEGVGLVRVPNDNDMMPTTHPPRMIFYQVYFTPGKAIVDGDYK